MLPKYAKRAILLPDKIKQKALNGTKGDEKHNPTKNSTSNELLCSQQHSIKLTRPNLCTRTCQEWVYIVKNTVWAQKELAVSSHK